MFRNIPYFEETGRFSVALPNAYNFSFHFPTLMRMYLLFFFLPAMYTMVNVYFRIVPTGSVNFHLFLPVDVSYAPAATKENGTCRC